MDRLPPRWIRVYGAMLIPSTALVFLIPPLPSYAQTWNIHQDGSGDAATIQAGIDSAAGGDTVLVGPGTYYENIDFLGKDVVLLAKHGPEVTTIDGSRAADSVVKLGTGESRAAVIEGFTITGGRGTAKYSGNSVRGGGVMCYRSSPTIRGNRIVGNTAHTGGGLAVGDGDIVSPRPFPLIEGNLFADNISDGNAGALLIEHADVIVRKNVFRRNSCVSDGGAIRLYLGEGSAELINNEFIENEARDKGGALLIVVPPQLTLPITVEGNLFLRNSSFASEGGGSGSGGAIWVYGASGTIIRNNTIVSNRGVDETVSGGGGILMESTSSGLTIEFNIVALNEGGGISCRYDVATPLGRNLLWMNSNADIGGPGSTCPQDWISSQLVADPVFCNPATDDYRVSSTSPALGEEVMGAYRAPGCGPGVAVRPTTWGRLKAQYR
jgi:parallel beta helix pectate lyase-like protein